MNIAYLTNQYPKVSHSFIRREIEALESIGVQISRLSIREADSSLIDPQDIVEKSKTWYLLKLSLVNIILKNLTILITRPLSFCRAFQFTFSISKGSEKGLLINMAYLIEACCLYNYCRKNRITHIHCHFGTNPTTVAMICKELGGPDFSFTSHGPEEYDKGKSISLSTKINKAKFVLAISYFGRSQLYRYTNYKNWSKIHIIRCTVSEKFIDSRLGSDSDSDSDSNDLICIGRLCEQKGQALLVDVVSELNSEGHNISLVLVGDGEMRGIIEEKIRQKQMENHITITGWASEAQVIEYIKNSKALLLPSFAEGLPVVIMESFALKKPVISSLIAGIPELVKDGHNGWLTPASDINSIKRAILELQSIAPAKLKDMGLNGRERVLKYHNSKLEAAKLANIFVKYSTSREA
jgi:glycosyltransferase involved in cell wall biosynthesis